MRCQLSLLSGLVLLSLAVSGCGSGALVSATGDASDGATVARRESRRNAFPLETGRFLGYTESGTAFVDPKVNYSLEVVGPASGYDAGAMEVVDPESRAIMRSDSRGVRLLALGDRREPGLRRLVRPMHLVTYPLRVGRAWESRYGRGPQSLKVRHWIADRLTVRTPEGSFEVYQIERRVWRGAYRPDFTADGVGRWTYYYAPGVGPVQIGTRWPGVTTQLYQLCSTRSFAFARADAAVADAGWRGLTAGLEPLLRE